MTQIAPSEVEIEIHPDAKMNGNNYNNNHANSANYQQSAENGQNNSNDSSQQQQQQQQLWFTNQLQPNKSNRFRRLNTEEKNSNNSAIQNTDHQKNSKFRIKRSKSWRRKFQYFFCCFSPTTIDFSSVDFEDGVMLGQENDSESLIGPLSEKNQQKKTLVLDLDETMVHSSFREVDNPDYVVPVEVEGALTDVYVLQRPHLDYFMEQVSAKYEVIVFTASLSKYADPLLDLLDEHQRIDWRLFREHCVYYSGAYVKDLSKLGRELRNIIIVDNSPNSYIFQPENAVPIEAFIDDMNDRALLDLLPLLMDLSTTFDVREGLKQWQRQLMTHGGIVQQPPMSSLT